MTVRLSVFAVRACAVLAAFGLMASTASADPPAPAPPPSTLESANPAFYVLVDPGSDRSAASVISIAVAGEFNKAFQSQGRAAASTTWAIPEAPWAPEQLVKQCATDPNTIGGVIVSYYIGDASHFWILWQTDTTTFSLFGQLVSCNRDAANRANPQTIAIVSQLHGSNGQLWTERRSQTSVPLLSFAAIVALLGRHYSSKSSATSTNTSIALASVGAAVVGQGLNKDIPGYSMPLRMRYGSIHLADDLLRELRYQCGSPQADDQAAALQPPPPPGPTLLALCNQTGLKH